MEERYALAEGKGRLTVRAAEGRVACEAMLPDDGRGLYKAYLSGPQGRFPLGALLPEGGTLVLRRTLSVGELERRGVWPPTGGGVELAYPAQRHPAAPPAPPGWVREAQPGRRMGGDAAGALCRRGGRRPAAPGGGRIFPGAPLPHGPALSADAAVLLCESGKPGGGALRDFLLQSLRVPQAAA